MSYPELQLSAQLCFLVHRLDRAILARYRPLLVELGLTYPQYVALLVLWEENEVTVSRLCERMRTDTGTVSPLLKRLVQGGWVKKTRSPEDERSVVVGLTKAGRALEERARSVPLRLARCLDAEPEEYAELHELLQNLVDRVELTPRAVPA